MRLRSRFVNMLLAAVWLAASPHTWAALDERTAAVLEAALAQRPAELATLYLGQQAEQRRIRRVLLMSDEVVRLDRRLSHAEAQALAEGALMPLPLPHGTQTVLIEVQHNHLDDAPMDHWQIEQRSLDAPDTPTSVVLTPPRWALWRNALSITTDSAALTRHAAFELTAGRPLRAAALLHEQASRGALPWEARLLQAEARHQLGFDSRASWRRLGTQAPPDIAAQAQLRLAEVALNQADSATAMQALAQLQHALPAAFHPRRSAVALSLRQGPAPLELDDNTLAQGEVMLATLNRAAMEGGSAGHAVLERLGRLTPEVDDELAWSVRDQANLMLGYSHLRHMRPALAQAAFAQVRASGPFSSAGRLGLGWAQISPGGAATTDTVKALPVGDALGDILRPRGDDATAQARRMTPFRTVHGVARGQRAEDLQRALQAWIDLMGADPLDPPVQEAMLAIAYALVHLGAFEDARARLDRGVEKLAVLNAELGAIELPQIQMLADQLIEHAADAQSWDQLERGSRWWRREQLPQHFHLERLLQQPALAATLQHCRQLREAARWLQDSPEPNLAQQAVAAVQQCQTRWSQATLTQIHAWQHMTERYLGEARLALARLHDRQIDFTLNAVDTP